MPPSTFVCSENFTSFFYSASLANYSRYSDRNSFIKLSSHFNFWRSYLPPASDVIRSHNTEILFDCDRVLSRAISQWILYNTTKLEGGTRFRKVSIGKFVRYSSLLQYKYFLGNSTYKYIDILSPEFSWADGIADCVGNTELTGWACGFESLNASTWNKSRVSHQTHRSRYDISDDVLHRALRTRVSLKDGFTQLLLYGKVMSMLVRPSHLVSEFMGSRILSLNNQFFWNESSIRGLLASCDGVNDNQHDDTNIKNSLHGAGTVCSFNSLSDFLKFEQRTQPGKFQMPSSTAGIQQGAHTDANSSELSTATNNHSTAPDWQGKEPTSSSSKAWASVSLHVRGGDSCDFILHNEVPPMQTYYTKDDQRPCFSADVYLKKLYQLRDQYNVRRVYLATDSHEMIKRIQNETEFNFIFLNISRKHFDRKHRSIECRPRDDNKMTFFSAVADFQLLQRGDIFLGTFASVYSKIAYFLMIGNKLRLLPFISLYYPMGCEAPESCADADIIKRNRTVEQTILHAVDCEIYPNDPCRIKGDISDVATPKRVIAPVNNGSSFKDGSVLKLKGKSDELYYLDRGVRRPLPDWDYFTKCLGRDQKDIVLVTADVMKSIPLGSQML